MKEWTEGTRNKGRRDKVWKAAERNLYVRNNIFFFYDWEICESRLSNKVKNSR